MDHMPELQPRNDSPINDMPAKDASTQTTEEDFNLLESSRDAGTQTTDEDFILLGPTRDKSTQTTEKDFLLLESTRDAGTQTRDKDFMLLGPTRDASTQTAEENFDLFARFQSTRSTSERETADMEALNNDHLDLNKVPKGKNIDNFNLRESDSRNATAKSCMPLTVRGNVAFDPCVSAPKNIGNECIRNTRTVHLPSAQQGAVYVSPQSFQNEREGFGFIQVQQLPAVPVPMTHSLLPQTEIRGTNNAFLLKSKL